MPNNILQLVMIPAVNGLVEVAKRAGLPNRFAPLLAVTLGVISGMGLRQPQESMMIGIIEGVVIGLSAVGMYSGTRNIFQSSLNKI